MKKEHFEILLEDIKGTVQLVLEGHDVLRHQICEVQQNQRENFEHLSMLIHGVNKRVDAVDMKIDAVDKKLSAKIDGVAADLAAHRADTECHSRSYRVSE
jgi:hypothetical protein